MTKIVVYRFSAMGDVAMLLPVFRGYLDKNPEIEIYFVTRRLFFPIFKNIPRLNLMEADLSGKHKGIVGLFTLFREIKKEIKPHYVIDEQSVLRTWMLDFFFTLSGVKTNIFPKGRTEKKRAIRTKKMEGLPHTIERYKVPFTKLGYHWQQPSFPILSMKKNDITISQKIHIPESKTCIKIGIAPFAKHPQKIWGIEKISELMHKLAANNHFFFYLFGGGQSELSQLHLLSAEFNNCAVVKDFLDFEEELQLMQQLDAMVTMDSANMHLAALCNISVLSIWGATHPSLGFSPYNQPPCNNIQYIGLKIACRPCSVYGKKKCIYNNLRCMEFVSADNVYSSILKIIQHRNQKSPDFL